jgi:hypothetical protein
VCVCVCEDVSRSRRTPDDYICICERAPCVLVGPLCASRAHAHVCVYLCAPGIHHVFARLCGCPHSCMFVSYSVFIYIFYIYICTPVIMRAAFRRQLYCARLLDNNLAPGSPVHRAWTRLVSKRAHAPSRPQLAPPSVVKDKSSEADFLTGIAAWDEEAIAAQPLTALTPMLRLRVTYPARSGAIQARNSDKAFWFKDLMNHLHSCKPPCRFTGDIPKITVHQKALVDGCLFHARVFRGGVAPDSAMARLDKDPVYGGDCVGCRQRFSEGQGDDEEDSITMFFGEVMTFLEVEVVETDFPAVQPHSMHLTVVRWRKWAQREVCTEAIVGATMNMFVQRATYATGTIIPTSRIEQRVAFAPIPIRQASDAGVSRIILLPLSL